MRIGAIADDVTGGTDLVSALRREGHRVVQTLGVPTVALPAVDSVVISLKTRMLPAAAACAETVRAAEYLRSAGTEQLYFKYCSTFDSTDAGNIGPVSETLLDHVGAPFTIACPSYPRLHRTVYLGHLFVGDRLLSESSMRNHPLTPMRDPDLVRVLGRQCRAPVGLVPLDAVEAGSPEVQKRFEGLEATGHRIAIVDAVFDRHLETIGRACSDFALVTGGAALGGALARVRPAVHGSGETREDVPVPAGPVAVLSGSCSSATLEQVQRLSGTIPSRALDPVRLVEAEGELDRLVNWAGEQIAGGQDVMIHSTAAPQAVDEAQERLGREEAATRIEAAFQALASELADRGVRTFLVAGGETSGAVLQALDIRMFGFGEEVAPGVPWTHSLDPEGFSLVLKSGNFGEPDFFLRALNEVRR